MKSEAVLLLNPVTNYLSIEVYCCFIKKTGLKPEERLVDYLNLHYSSFIDAINLVALGEIEDLHRMSYSKSRRMQASFPTLSKAKEVLWEMELPLYFYDMSEKKYKWIEL